MKCCARLKDSLKLISFPSLLRYVTLSFLTHKASFPSIQTYLIVRPYFPTIMNLLRATRYFLSSIPTPNRGLFVPHFTEFPQPLPALFFLYELLLSMTLFFILPILVFALFLWSVFFFFRQFPPSYTSPPRKTSLGPCKGMGPLVYCSPSFEFSHITASFFPPTTRNSPGVPPFFQARYSQQHLS